jgi:hypothetical protein
MTHTILTDLNGQKFRATAEQAEALESLSVARQGGIATVYGYKAESGRTVPTVYDAQLITRFSVENLYKRKMAALSDLRFSDVKEFIDNDPILSKLPESELLTIFNARKAKEVDSMNTTLTGDRSDAHRQGHDRCYARVADGIKVHFVTEKVDGLMQPVLTDGLPTVASIMVACLELNRNVREPGEYKVVKSGAPVLMSNAVSKALNKRSVGLKFLSLKEGNFERLIVARKSYLPEDVAGIPADILNG